MKGDHARRAVSTQTNPEQTRRWRGRVGQRAESNLRCGFAGNASEHDTRQPKIRMIEDIEKLSFEAELDALSQREPFR